MAGCRRRRQGDGGLGTDGGRIDHHAPGSGVGQQRGRHGFNVGRVRYAQHHHIILGDLLQCATLARVGSSKRLGFAGGARVDHDREPSLDQVTSHVNAHEPEADKANGELHRNGEGPSGTVSSQRKTKHLYIAMSLDSPLLRSRSYPGNYEQFEMESIPKRGTRCERLKSWVRENPRKTVLLIVLAVLLVMLLGTHLGLVCFFFAPHACPP